MYFILKKIEYGHAAAQDQNDVFVYARIEDMLVCFSSPGLSDEVYRKLDKGNERVGDDIFCVMDTLAKMINQTSRYTLKPILFRFF